MGGIRAADLNTCAVRPVTARLEQIKNIDIRKRDHKGKRKHKRNEKEKEIRNRVVSAGRTTPASHLIYQIMAVSRTLGREAVALQILVVVWEEPDPEQLGQESTMPGYRASLLAAEPNQPTWSMAQERDWAGPRALEQHPHLTTPTQ